MTAPRIPLSELEQGIPFEQRHIGPDSEARAKMLAQVGYGSLDELTAAAVPDVIKNVDALDLPAARTEAEVLDELRSLADRNQVLGSMIGLGYYGTFTPPVILRNVMDAKSTDEARLKGAGPDRLAHPHRTRCRVQ